MSNVARIKVGIVGCGEVTEHKHLPALRRLPDVEVAAVADSDAGRREHVADRFGIPSRYCDVEALVADPTVTVVGVCVPPQAHAAVALPALAAGKHVLIEKPLALSLDDCDRLVEGVRRASGKCMMAFHMRWHRLVRQARDILSTGRLGELESIRAVWNSPRSDKNIPDWKRRRETGGGALIELAVHHADLWRFLLGCDVEEVYAQARSGLRDDESAVLTGRMANGVLVSAAFSERTSHEIELEIAGRNGRLRLSCLRFDGLEWYAQADVPGNLRTRLRHLAHLLREFPRGLWTMRHGGDYRLSFRGLWRHFVDAVREDSPVGATLEDGRRAVQVVLAAAESASSGQPVAVGHAARGVQSLA
jgi:predicted dehydrogenase